MVAQAVATAVLQTPTSDVAVSLMTPLLETPGCGLYTAYIAAQGASKERMWGDVATGECKERNYFV